MDLNDTTTKSYLNTTAEQDKSVIEQQLEANQQLDPKIAADFTFDNTTPLHWYKENRIHYNVKANDGSKGNGFLNIYVDPYTPGPTPHKKASTLNPSDPKASTINPSKQKASSLTPSTSTEDPSVIVNKLKNASVKLDPNYWLNKNIQDYQAALNDQFFNQGILTKAESNTLTWNSLLIYMAGYYYYKASFTVHSAGKTATGTTTLNASIGETPAQIAAKINAAGDNAHCHIIFNYAWWQGKRLSQNLAMFRSILVNEHILTVAEASIINGMPFDNPPYPNFLVPLKASLNDGNTTAATDPVTASIYYVTDGSSAQTIASELTNKTVNLSFAEWKNKSIAQNLAKFRADLINEHIMSAADASHMSADGETWAITKPGQITNLTFAAEKDGQIYKATNVTLNITI